MLKQHQSKRKEEKKKEEDKELEARIKKKDAVKFFDSWKAKKDEELKETHRKKKQEVKQKNRKKEEDKQEKVKSASKVYDNWWVSQVGTVYHPPFDIIHYGVLAAVSSLLWKVCHIIQLES